MIRYYYSITVQSRELELLLISILKKIIFCVHIQNSFAQKSITQRYSQQKYIKKRSAQRNEKLWQTLSTLVIFEKHHPGKFIFNGLDNMNFCTCLRIGRFRVKLIIFPRKMQSVDFAINSNKKLFTFLFFNNGLRRAHI